MTSVCSHCSPTHTNWGIRGSAHRIEEAPRDRGLPRSGCQKHSADAAYDQEAVTWHAKEPARLSKLG
ncbi:MAG: hypothetical protein CL908_01765 [Deltaproteobacteria bacterium]|nr:hypothetical protein [Deltaproteobacteria bacterium]